MRVDDVFEARVVQGVGGKRPVRKHVFNYHHSRRRSLTGGDQHWATVTSGEEWPKLVARAKEEDRRIFRNDVFTYGDVTIVRISHDMGEGTYSILASNKADADAAMRKHIETRWITAHYPKQWFDLTEARIVPGVGRKARREHLFLFKHDNMMSLDASLIDMGPIRREQWLGLRPEATKNDDDTVRTVPFTGEYFIRALDFESAIKRLETTRTSPIDHTHVRYLRHDHESNIKSVQVVAGHDRIDVNVFINPDKNTVERLLANGPLRAIISMSDPSKLYVLQAEREFDVHEVARHHLRIAWPTILVLKSDRVLVVVGGVDLSNHTGWWAETRSRLLHEATPLVVIYGRGFHIEPLKTNLLEAKIVPGAGQQRAFKSIFVYSADFGKNEFSVTQRRYTEADWKALPGTHIRNGAIKDNSRNDGDMYVKARNREEADQHIIAYFGPAANIAEIRRSFPGWLKEAKIIPGVGRKKPERRMFYKFAANLNYEEYSITAYLDSDARWAVPDGRRLGHFVYHSGGREGYVVYVREHDLEKARTMAIHLMSELGWNAPDVRFAPWKTLRPVMDKDDATLR